MGLFARTAVKMEQRRLAPFFRPDEHFLDTDICEMVKIRFHDDGSPGSITGQVAISITNRALYIREVRGGGAQSVRVPFEEVVDLGAARDMYEVVTKRASWVFRDEGKPLIPDKYELIAAQLRKVENHRQVVDVPGGKISALHRPYEEGASGEWIFQTSEGVDITAPEVRSALEESLAGPIAKWGPLDT